MHEKPTEYRLPIAVPNGIILALMGVLVLVTPMVEAVEPSKLRMNIIAGVVMTVGGLASLLWGLRQTRRPGG